MRSMSVLLYRSPHPAHTPYPGWQSPYVDLFRHFAVGKWEKSAKQGEVSEVMVSAAGSFGHGDAVTLYWYGRPSSSHAAINPRNSALINLSVLLCTGQDTAHQSLPDQWRGPSQQLHSITQSQLTLPGACRPLSVPGVPGNPRALFCRSPGRCHGGSFAWTCPRTLRYYSAHIRLLARCCALQLLNRWPHLSHAPNQLFRWWRFRPAML